MRTVIVAMLGLAVGCGAFATSQGVSPTTATANAPTTRPFNAAPARTVLASDEVVLPIRIIDGLPYANVDIGKKTALFMIDTGSACAMISPKLATEEELASLGTCGNDDAPEAKPSQRFVTCFPSTWGVPGLTTWTQQYMTVNRLPEGVGGVLGWRVFSDVLMAVDYPNRRLVLRRGKLPSPDGEEILPIRLVPPDGFAIPASLNGTERWFYLDTGCSIGVLQTDAGNLEWHAPPVQVTLQNEHSNTIGKVGRARGELRVGRHIIREPIMAIDPARKAPDLGCDLLRNFVVTFDFRNKRLRLQRSSDQPIVMPPITSDLPFQFQGRQGHFCAIWRRGGAGGHARWRRGRGRKRPRTAGGWHFAQPVG